MSCGLDLSHALVDVEGVKVCTEIESNHATSTGARQSAQRCSNAMLIFTNTMLTLNFNLLMNVLPTTTPAAQGSPA